MLTLEEREFNAVVKDSLRSIAKSLASLAETQRKLYELEKEKFDETRPKRRNC